MTDELPPVGEGVIRFAWTQRAADGPLLSAQTFAALRAWRRICRRLRLVGQEPDRYDGFGFGNLSVRDPANPDAFIITASQTSGAADLEPDDLVRVSATDIASFRVVAEGSRPPSSEAMTHAMIYKADPRVAWIFHAHCPEVWHATDRLELPATPAEVPYGSPAMAQAVSLVLALHDARPLVFTTLGHEDGVFACGSTASSTGLALVDCLAQALGETGASRGAGSSA